MGEFKFICLLYTYVLNLHIYFNFYLFKVANKKYSMSINWYNLSGKQFANTDQEP